MKLDSNNNNTGALDNREQQMDSGGSTLLVSGYYEQSAISGVTSKMVTMSLYHCLTMSPSCSVMCSLWIVLLVY